MEKVLRLQGIPLNEFQRHADRIRDLYFNHENESMGFSIYPKTTCQRGSKNKTSYSEKKRELGHPLKRKRKTSPWYKCADTMLREEIYRYARAIERRKLTDGLKAYIERRDYDREYRVPEPDAIEWTTRLVNVGKMQTIRFGSSKGGRYRKLLFKENAGQTRLLAQLKLAAQLGIHWRYLGLFVNAIEAYDNINQSDCIVQELKSQNWVSILTRQADKLRRKAA
jgi:hypothetical protein